MKSIINKDVHTKIIVIAIIGLILGIVGFFIDRTYWFFAPLVAVVYIALEIITSDIRRKRTEALSAAIDRILHNEEEIAFDEFSEGEFAILSSEIHKMTVRLRQQRTALQADKEYLSDSIADISHQIKTPLTSLNLIVSLLSERELSEERRYELLHETKELLVRIDWLITTLLKMSKLDAGTVKFRKESAALSDLIKKATEPLLIPIELREQELKLNISQSAYFEGDISWTAEAVSNIVKNCMEHTENGGEIEISAEENTLYTQITICDNGSGIDKDDLPHIFERFYKGKNSDEKSYGIGLALARMIIISQNGTIKAENRSKGARFTIRFYKQTV